MNTSNSGIKISTYPQALVNETNQRGKLQYEHYLMSYGSVNYGFSTVNKNYKVPVSALREDFKGYIGFENAKGGWRQLTRLWYGEWYRTKETFVKNGDDMEKITVGDKVNSYLYKWSDSEIGQDDYICNKFGDELDDNGENYDKVPTDRIFIIKNAPIPCEYNFATSFVKRDKDGNPIQDKDGNYEYETYDCDPYPQFAKIVDKEYIDNRFNGIRVIDVSDTVEEIIEEAVIQPYTEDGEIDTSIRDFLIKPEWKSILKIRPYTCIYDYTNFKIDDGYNPIPLIDIWDNLDDGTGKTTKELLNERKEKSLIFYIKLSKPVFKDGERHKGILIAANSNFASRYFNYNEKDADGNDLKDESGNIIVTKGYENYYSPYTVWAFPGERHEIFNNAREAQRDVLIKVQCSYDDDGNLNLVCTNAFNYEPGTSNMTVFDRYISDGVSDKSSNKVPSSKTLYNHIFGTQLDEIISATQKPYNESVNDIHVRKSDRDSWESHVDDSSETHSSMINPTYEVDSDGNIIKELPISQHHFVNDEKAAWLEEIYGRIHTVESNASPYLTTITTRNLGGGEEDSKTNVQLYLNVTDEITTKRTNNDSLVSIDALYTHAFDGREINKVESTPLHVNADEKVIWGEKLDNVYGDKFINAIKNNKKEEIEIPTGEDENSTTKLIKVTEQFSELSLNVCEDIALATEEQLSDTVPTTGAVSAHVAQHSGIYYDDNQPKCGNFRFKGSHVHQIISTKDGMPFVEFYFGPNNNPDAASTIDGLMGDTFYIYEKIDDVIPRGFIYTDNGDGTKDTKYTHVYKVGSSIHNLQINERLEQDGYITVPVDLSGEKMTQISATLKRKTGDDTYTDVRTVGCLLKIKTDANGKYILETDEPLSLGDLGNLSITPTENEGVTTYSIKSRYYKTIDNKQISLGVQVCLDDITINQNEDAEDGFIPGYARLKASININPADSGTADVNTAINTEGIYDVVFKVYNAASDDKYNKEIKLDNEIFVYNESKPASNFISAMEVVPTYVNGDSDVKWVSGIQYDTNPKINLSITKIPETQPTVTKSLRRVRLTSSNNTGNTSNTSTFKDITLYKKDLTDKSSVKAGEVFSYTNSYTLTSSGDVGYLNKKFCAAIYKQTAEKDTGDNVLYTDKKEASVVSKRTINNNLVDRWFWNHTAKSKSLNQITFHDDSERYYNAFDINGKQIIWKNLENKNYDSEASLLDEYTGELLVQGGLLKHPKHDSTKAYSDAGGTRQYVQKIHFIKGNDTSLKEGLGEIKITVNGFNQSWFNSANSPVKLYIARNDTDYLHLINAMSNITEGSKITGCATNSYVNGSWNFKNLQGVEPFKSNTDYYLVITMTDEVTSNIGKITFEVL